ncbi:MAG TPA: AAA family ATPase [Planctomycetota bacterium]|nr:AAA family ATPase [Planctomycetota bacterium]
MDVRSINQHLQAGQLDVPGLFPHLDRLRAGGPIFEIDFGLGALPEVPGVLLVRGPRQYGKSTWLEGQLEATIRSAGPASAFYLNGDQLADTDALVHAIRGLVPGFAKNARVRRLFIDEITAVADWERGLKQLLDAGELRDVLVVTTGSRATDLRRGAERLPGRKGRMSRTAFLFTPLSFAEFERVCGGRFGEDSSVAYLLCGGCPVAARELAQHGLLPEHVIEMVRDWVLGECAASGRARGSLLAVWNAVLARGGTPIGQALLARETGLANNTTAAGYLELLGDLMCIGSAFAWDPSRRIALRRKPAKFPPINLLAAVAFDGSRLRSVTDFEALPPEVQGRWWEWLVAQELWRRAALRGEQTPEELLFWASGDREIDYVVRPELWIEVKRGGASALEFAWFARSFPRAELRIVGRERFAADRIRGLTMAELLRDPSW